ncbi:MAG TPA: alkaline phosphatase family protein, partial [Myxococcales bacterium]
MFQAGLLKDKTFVITGGGTGLGAEMAKRFAELGARSVVLVVVDQLRYQDVLWLAPALGPRGFAGMGRAAPMRYETAVAETAPGHAVLSTGAYANVNGIVGNSFWQGARYQEAVDDPACPVWGAKAGRSAAALRAPTIGDMLKLNTGGAARVVGIAVK